MLRSLRSMRCYPRPPGASLTLPGLCPSHRSQAQPQAGRPPAPLPCRGKSGRFAAPSTREVTLSAFRREPQQDRTRLPSCRLVWESEVATGGCAPLLQSPAPKPTTRPQQSGTGSAARTHP
ncbi:hypothetical protein NDU88_002736 [Pleurodeles waltl]|uniref:Uncharacterized protein n=1 Tax=Pleurodeles waltl TaxID=8319 RepID=A0AAV7W4W5_PLEWA|nr:hypothetical protein NDU88_002736 [Pleurodeles waltl]